MDIKSLLNSVVGEMKKLGDVSNLTVNQLFYFALVLGKVSSMFNMPWWMVVGLPLASPAHIKDAVGVITGMVGKLFEVPAKKK